MSWYRRLSKSPQVDKLREGHLLRWTKQMALRGKGRNFDEHGVCGHQKVVCRGNADQYERLIANAAHLGVSGVSGVSGACGFARGPRPLGGPCGPLRG